MLDDMEFLRGSWDLKALEAGGTHLPVTELGPASLTIEASQFVMASSIGRASRGSFCVQPSLSPRGITLKFETGTDKGRKSRGIYELAGDTLKLCLANGRATRPSVFASTAGSGLVVYTYARAAIDLLDPSGTSELFFGTLDDLERFGAQAKASIELIASATSIRLIVLETWLFIDYAVRELLMSGLQLDRVDNEDFEIRDALLPKGLLDCVRLLRRLRDVNLDLPEEPEHAITGPARMWKHFREIDPGLGKRLAAAQESYRKTFQLPPRPSALWPRPVYRSVPKGWIEAVSRVDKNWIKRAEELNKARNLAAHSHDESNIALQLRVQGPDRLEGVRTACLGLIRELTGFDETTDFD